jgi:hypothetical protein
MKNTSSRGKSAMGGGKSHSKAKSSHKPHEIHIRRGHSGGFIAKHIHKTDPDTGVTPEEEEHVLADMPSLQSHIAENMGDQGSAQAPPQAAATPQPQVQPASAPVAAQQ